MEYKYSTINEVNHFEFGEAVVGDIQLTERMFHLVLDNVKICPENSCNRDIRMMRTNELLFKISDAEIISLVEEGYNEYDADGNLKHTYPDEEVEKAKYFSVSKRVPSRSKITVCIMSFSSCVSVQRLPGEQKLSRLYTSRNRFHSCVSPLPVTFSA